MRNQLGEPGLRAPRWAVGCAAIGGAGLVLGLAALGWAWSRASSRECADLPREDLSLSEMADVHRQLQAYKRDPATPMVFSAREASFMLREEFELLAWFSTRGDAIEGEARLQKAGRCWNVSFLGQVAVDDGRATVVPSELRVGELSLGWLVRGHAFDLGPEAVDVQPGRARELLSHLDLVRVEDDRVSILVDDPKWIR